MFFFHIDDLARDADTKLFRQASDHIGTVYIHSSPNKDLKIVVLP